MKNISTHHDIDRRQELLLLVFPALFWLYIFQDFLTGRIVINVDSNANYAIFKYLFNSIFNGVIPLWNPYIHGGVPNVLITSAGFLNPLVAFLSLLHFIGLNYYQIYVLYLVVYYFFGLWGFYLLAKRIFAEKIDALLAYWLLLFSGMGAMVFTQIYLVQMFVTAVWFFYFLLSFAKRFYKRDLVGITFSAIILCYSYLPPYFVTLFGIFVLLSVCLFPRQCLKFIAQTVQFIKKEKACVAICSFLLVLAVGFFVVPQQANGSPDLFFAARHDDMTGSLEKLQGAKMELREAGFKATTGERMAGGRLLSHLDKYPYTEDSFFYLPVMVYVLTFLSLLADFDRRRALLLFLGTGIFLISLGMAYPLYPFLFSKISFFQLFRNLFLFMAFLIPLAVLFAVSQWRALLNIPFRDRRQKRFVAVISTILHVLFLMWMNYQGGILLSSYVTVILSWTASLLVITGKLSQNKFILPAILLFICLLEPLDVFEHYRANALNFSCQLPREHVHPQFSYTRGEDFSEELCPLYCIRSYQEYWYGMLMRDSSGEPGHHPLVISKWMLILWNNIEEDVFRDYLHYKFWIYNGVRYFHKSDAEQAEFDKAFRERSNTAFVFGESGEGDDTGPAVEGKASAITGDSDNFRMQSFSPDEVAFSTHFDKKKFLVFTDAYHKDWKVFVNGRMEKIYRANVAFKGIWLPEGTNNVVFRYLPSGGSVVYIGAFAAQMTALIYLCYLYFRGQGKRRDE